MRAIEVTTRNALQQVSGETERARVKVMATDLLDRLEDRLLRQGGDWVLLEAVEAARHRIWD